MNTKPFEWTNDLIEEYAQIKIVESYLPHRTSMNDFIESKTPKPILTTEDGVDIYDGDQLVWDTSDVHWDYLDTTPAVYMPNLPNRKAWFNKKAAEEYILKNKPCLSIREVEDVLESNQCKYHNVIEELEELIRRK